MATNVVRLNMRKAMAEHVTMQVRVTGLRLAKWRLRFAIPLIRLAAMVAGTGFQVESSQREEYSSAYAEPGVSMPPMSAATIGPDVDLSGATIRPIE